MKDGKGNRTTLNLRTDFKIYPISDMPTEELGAVSFIRQVRRGGGPGSESKAQTQKPAYLDHLFWFCGSVVPLRLGHLHRRVALGRLVS